jgi:hypothetical protein
MRSQYPTALVTVWKPLPRSSSGTDEATKGLRQGGIQEDEILPSAIRHHKKVVAALDNGLPLPSCSRPSSGIATPS